MSDIPGYLLASMLVLEEFTVEDLVKHSGQDEGYIRIILHQESELIEKKIDKEGTSKTQQVYVLTEGSAQKIADMLRPPRITLEDGWDLPIGVEAAISLLLNRIPKETNPKVVERIISLARKWLQEDIISEDDSKGRILKVTAYTLCHMVENEIRNSHSLHRLDKEILRELSILLESVDELDMARNVVKQYLTPSNESGFPSSGLTEALILAKDPKLILCPHPSFEALKKMLREEATSGEIHKFLRRARICTMGCQTNIKLVQMYAKEE